MRRERIRTAVINGQRVVVMDKLVDNGIFRQTVCKVCKVTTSGSMDNINKYVKEQKYARNPHIKAKIEHERELHELRRAL